MIEHPRTLPRPHLAREEVGAIAAGNNFAFTPPARTHIEIISLHVQLATDATVTNRRMRIVIGGVADDDAMIMATGTQAASQLIEYFFLRGLGYSAGAPGADGSNSGLPMGLIFANPEQVRSEITNLQGGDQITRHIIRYMIWQDPVYTL